MKICTKCGCTKPLDHFQRDSSKRDGRKPRCKSCTAEYVASVAPIKRQQAADWRAKNPGAHNKEYKRQWRAANAERIKAQRHAHYEQNRNAILEKNRAYQAVWILTNKHKVLAATVKRRTRTRRATPPWADDTIIRFLYATRQYISQETESLWHVDHVVPLQGGRVSGLHVHNNLRIVPATFNWSKGNTFPVT